MNTTRDPTQNPIPGDVVEWAPYATHLVTKVEEGVVHYWDNDLWDHVPLERWRAWAKIGKPAQILSYGTPA